MSTYTDRFPVLGFFFFFYNILDFCVNKYRSWFLDLGTIVDILGVFVGAAAVLCIVGGLAASLASVHWTLLVLPLSPQL